jgi:hypothetical protein
MNPIFLNLILGFKKEIAISCTVLISLLGMYLLGLQHGQVPHSQECSTEIIALSDRSAELKTCHVDLASCKSKKAGVGIIEKSEDCDLRIKKALSDAKAWVCED